MTIGISEMTNAQIIDALCDGLELQGPEYVAELKTVLTTLSTDELRRFAIDAIDMRLIGEALFLAYSYADEKLDVLVRYVTTRDARMVNTINRFLPKAKVRTCGPQGSADIEKHTDNAAAENSSAATLKTMAVQSGDKLSPATNPKSSRIVQVENSQGATIFVGGIANEMATGRNPES